MIYYLLGELINFICLVVGIVLSIYGLSGTNKWNRIRCKKGRFPIVDSKDSIFSGKLISDIPQISKDMDQLPSHQSTYELTYLIVACIIFISIFVKCIWIGRTKSTNKRRKRIFSYPVMAHHGVAAVLLLVVGIGELFSFVQNEGEPASNKRFAHEHNDLIDEIYNVCAEEQDHLVFRKHDDDDLGRHHAMEHDDVTQDEDVFKYDRKVLQQLGLCQNKSAKLGAAFIALLLAILNTFEVTVFCVCHDSQTMRRRPHEEDEPVRRVSDLLPELRDMVQAPSNSSIRHSE